MDKIILCCRFLSFVSISVLHEFFGGVLNNSCLLAQRHSLSPRPSPSCTTSFSSQEGGVLNSRPTPRGGHRGVLYSARRGLRMTEAWENWEERKRKKTTPEGSQFFPFPILLWVTTMNFVRESESCPHNCLLMWLVIFHSVMSRIPCDQGASRNILWKIHWGIKIVKGLSFGKAWGNRRKRLF